MSTKRNPTTVEPVDVEVEYDIEKETEIEVAGVVRCCLATVAEEHLKPENRKVKLGAKSQCLHCKLTFTLAWCARRRKPIWKPDWQLEDDAKKAKKP